MAIHVLALAATAALAIGDEQAMFESCRPSEIIHPFGQTSPETEDSHSREILTGAGQSNEKLKA